jgi:hypothetical protein
MMASPASNTSERWTCTCFPCRTLIKDSLNRSGSFGHSTSDGVHREVGRLRMVNSRIDELKRELRAGNKIEVICEDAFDPELPEEIYIGGVRMRVVSKEAADAEKQRAEEVTRSIMESNDKICSQQSEIIRLEDEIRALRVRANIEASNSSSPQSARQPLAPIPSIPSHIQRNNTLELQLETQQEEHIAQVQALQQRLDASETNLGNHLLQKNEDIEKAKEQLLEFGKMKLAMQKMQEEKVASDLEKTVLTKARDDALIENGRISEASGAKDIDIRMLREENEELKAAVDEAYAPLERVRRKRPRTEE